VSAAAEKLAYGRISPPSNLSGPNTLTVGVVVSDIQNPFYPELLDVLQTELGFLGIQALLFNQRTPTIMTPALMSLVGQHSLSGLILTSVSASWSLPTKLSSGEVPTVLLNRLIDGSAIDSVSADNLDGGRQAAEYLIGLGHLAIGIVSGPLDISTHRDRRQGFMEVSSAAPQVAWYEGPLFANDYSHATGFHSARRILRTHPEVTAIFCTNDLMAYGALSAARREGRSVPEDLSVLGFDDIAMSSWDVMDLSTIHHPFREMAKAASQRLADMIAGVDVGQARHIQLPVHVVPRATTRPLILQQTR
jgi:LacI family transcriptional regulator